MAEKPYERTGMVVLQAESEVAAINMVYGAAAAGKRALTSSSSPGISLKMEGISYMAGAELPGVILNVVRGGPGLGTIQPSQADYFQATKGGGHGDYRLIVLAPSSVQEMYDFVGLAFELTFKYRNPVMMLSDGVIGQMMEKVQLSEPVPRRTSEELIRECPWATTGKPNSRERNIITSLNLDSAVHEKHNIHLQDKYRKIEEAEVRYEEFQCEDAEYLYIAYGSSARIVQKSVQMARSKGIKAGLVRLVTLFPFPKKRIAELALQVKGMLAIEMSAGQMVEDVRLAVSGKVPVDHYGRMGGMIPSPEEVVVALEKRFIGG
jgi:2-oxoglutarate ferredoxin oxidoreductase subunit alpha